MACLEPGLDSFNQGARRKELCDRGKHFGSIDRFGGVTIATSLETFIIVASHGVGSQSNNGSRIIGITELPGGSVTIHEVFQHRYVIERSRFNRHTERDPLA